MASRAPRFLLGYFKWFIVPLGVGLLGFYVVGPKLSQMNSPIIKNLEKLKATAVSAPPVTPKETEPTKKLPDPDVQVSVHK